MIVVHKGHRVRLGEQYEMGEGVESYSPSCDCGWRGVPVDTHANQALYGERAQAPLAGHVGGDHSTAVLQVLEHVQYEPELDEAMYRKGMAQLTEEFFATDTRSLSWATMNTQARILERAVGELRDVRHRQMIWATREERTA